MESIADPDSFDRFYEAELGGQVRRAFLLLGSSDEANDVVHDSFVNIFPKWGQIENPGGYLNRSVMNGCRDVARRRERKSRLLPRLIDRTPNTPPVDILGDALLGLPFNHRAAVVLRFYVGMTTDEIAVELDCAPGSVGPWISRGLKQLRKALK